MTVWTKDLQRMRHEDYDALAARLAEAERRATTLQADLDRAIESALKANAINTDWRRDWKAAVIRAEAAEARVRELTERMDALMPLFEEARDALPAISLASAKLHGVRLDLASRMDDVGDPEKWAKRAGHSAGAVQEGGK